MKTGPDEQKRPGHRQRDPDHHAEDVSPHHERHRQTQDYGVLHRGLADTQDRRRRGHDQNGSERQHRIHSRVGAFPRQIEIERDQRRDPEAQHGAVDPATEKKCRRDA